VGRTRRPRALPWHINDLMSIYGGHSFRLLVSPTVRHVTVGDVSGSPPALFGYLPARAMKLRVASMPHEHITSSDEQLHVPATADGSGRDREAARGSGRGNNLSGPGDPPARANGRDHPHAATRWLPDHPRHSRGLAAFFIVRSCARSKACRTTVPGGSARSACAISSSQRSRQSISKASCLR
jgi:hypothetical protein